MVGLPVIILINKTAQEFTGLSATASNTIIGLFMLTALMFVFDAMGRKGTEWNI